MTRPNDSLKRQRASRCARRRGRRRRRRLRRLHRRPGVACHVTDSGVRLRHQRRARLARQPRFTCSAARCWRPTRASSSTSRSTSTAPGTPCSCRSASWRAVWRPRTPSGCRRSAADVRRVDSRAQVRLSRRHGDGGVANQVIAVQSQDPNVCGVSVTGSTLYAKLVVTAINIASAQQLTIRYTVDPNCGFLLVRGRHPQGLNRARPSSSPRAARSAARRHAPSWHARRARARHRSWHALDA